MTLTWTAATKAQMYQFMDDKVWYKFEDQTSVWDAWATANSSSANASKYSGRAMTFMMSTAFVEGWIADPQFVKKWSGGCLKDHSSAMGGICLLETNDTNTEGTSNTAANIYGISGATTDVQGDDTNRGVLTYRLSEANFDALETAWTDMADWDSGSSTQDGRCYYNYLDTNSLLVDTTNAAMIEYLDYPKCTQGTDAGDTDSWYCQLFLPARDQQTTGYPRFDTPGVITGYYMASYIPNVENVSFSKTSQIIQTSDDGATSITTLASAIVAVVACLTF